MGIEYQNKPIDWDNAGIMPPQDLIEKGFQPGYKPPAEYFNAILHNTSEAIKEIQEKTIEMSDAAGGGTVGSTIIDVSCTYAEPDTEAGTSGEYTITTDVDLQSEDFFCLRFVAPNDYVKDTVFSIGSEAYTAVNAGFKENDLVILNFDVSQQKCFFVSGGGEEKDDKSAGKKVEGETFTIDGTEVVAKSGAEIFNNYNNNIATGNYSAAFGYKAIASGDYSFAAGHWTKVSASGSMVCGRANTLNSLNSFATGYNNTINGSSSGHGIICGGTNNTVGEQSNAAHSFIAGSNNNVSGMASVVAGYGNTEKGSNNVVSGYNNVVNGFANAVFGANNKNYENSYSTNGVCIAGIGNKAITENNSPADYATVFGVGNIGKGINFVCGLFNKSPNPTNVQLYSTSMRGDLFVVGNGTGTTDGNYNATVTSRSNAFRIACDGSVYGTKSYTASGADYAEMFEWADGNPDNEDRRGLFVTLDGEKIRPASADDDYILGVVSATPSVVADAQTDDWGKKWKTDVFGERLLDENGAWILNENFREEENESYVSRLDRKEWAAVGLVGKLIIVDDGTCEVNGYCVPANGGKATKSETGYRVLSRIDENHIKVLIK